MRLLQILRTLDPSYGGPLEGARATAAALSEMGHRCDLLSLDLPSAGLIGLGPTQLGAYGYSACLTLWLEQHAKTYDAILVHGIWHYQSFGSWRALSKQRTPWFVYTHGMLDPWFEQSRAKHLKKSLYWRLAEHRTLRDATAVLFTTEEERRLAHDSFLPFRCRERVVSFGIPWPPGHSPSTSEQLHARFPQFSGRKLIVFLGRVHPKKGCDLLIEAFSSLVAAHPDLHLVIVGPDNGGFTGQLHKLVADSSLQLRVTLTGPLFGDLKWALLRRADLFILPSHSENFGVTVVEALACGSLVAISNKVNIWNDIDQDQAGLVAPDDLEGTTQLLSRWLAMNEEQTRQMRERALSCFEHRFEIKHAIEQLLRVFAEFDINTNVL